MRKENRIARRPFGATRGQALVEFSLALIPFLLILLGIADLGRGIYMSNGVNQAAREIARTTAVHVCGSPCTVGNSPETAATIDTQKNLVPGLAGAGGSVTFACTKIDDSSASCTSGNFMKVTVSVPYAALTPLLSMIAPSTLSASAHVEIP
jgi:Flp pilus assembly protein TadG